jgi:hypothetical protein
LQLFCFYIAVARQQQPADSIVLRYATDTCSNRHPAGPFLVKFSRIPAVSTLGKYGLLLAITRYHYILQQRPAGEKISACYIANNNYKATVLLLQQLEQAAAGDSVLLQVSFRDRHDALQYAGIRWYSDVYHAARVKVKKQDWQAFIGQEAVTFADVVQRAHTEIIINTSNLIVNRINIAQQQFPQIDGSRISVSVKEDRFDTADIDLRGRYLPSDNVSIFTSSHALVMATLIGGAGNSGDKGKGAATGVKLSSADFNSSLFPDNDNYYTQSAITTQNHSYGNEINNVYGAEAAAYDKHIVEADTIVHVFSAGNIGTQTSASGRYQGVPGYANLTGNYKQAKNIITVGGTDGLSKIVALSSKGPAYDGRIKPEIAAYGEDGTSGAAALTSGVTALLQDAWRLQYQQPMPSALTRAVIINSALRAPGELPGFDHGFGYLHALSALKTIQEKRILQGEIKDGAVSTFNIDVPVNTEEVKITLCWNDPPAAVNAAKALVNDLDLEAAGTGGQRWLPWVLNNYPLTDSLTQAPVRGKDSLNNVEQISIFRPAGGRLQISVKGAHVTTPGQKFYLAYQFTPMRSFQWQYPAPGSILPAGREVPLQWETSYSGNGDLAWSSDSGHTWQPLGQQLPMVPGSYNWLTPGTLQRAWLKLTLPDTSFISAAFYISPATTLHTGFNCADSTLIYWNAIPGATGYQLLTLGTSQLIPYRQQADTFAFIAKSQVPSRYFAVSPVAREGWIGMRSYAADYSQQGVGCYVANLLADKTTSGGVLLSLNLGSTYQLQTVYWERLTGKGWITIHQDPVNNALQFSYADNGVPDGLLRYRVRLETTGGTYIYSDPVSIEIMQQHTVLLFPNPVSTTLYILDSTERSRQLVITDISGRIMLQQRLEATQETVPVQQLANGVYTCSIYLNGKRIYTTKFVKQQ